MEYGTRHIKIRDINPHVVCSLCAGYFVDATTITECLHTFCKSCIVKYLQTSKFCPTCNLKIHETQPLFNLQIDRTMQDIVYRIVPGIQDDEERRKREFYESRGVTLERPKSPVSDENDEEKKGEEKVRRDFTQNKNSYKDDELVSLCIEKFRDMELSIDVNIPTLSRKYLRCSTRVLVHHLERFLTKKLGLPAMYQVEILCNGVTIHPQSSLKFIWICHWRRKSAPMVLQYRFCPVS